MTYRSFTDNFPLPVQRLMADPTSWAVVGSVGLHGIILALLPLMSLPSFSDTEPDIENRVPVVELGPEELSRVPNFAESAVPLPDDFSSFSDDFSSSSFDLEDFQDLNNVPDGPITDFSQRPRLSRPRLQQPLTWPSFNLPAPTRPPRSSSTPPPAQPPSEPEPETPPAETETSNTETPVPATEQDTEESPNTEQTNENSGEVATNTGEPSSEEAEPQTPQERLFAEQQQLQQQFTYQRPTDGEVETAFNAWKEAANSANIQQGEPVTIEVAQSLLTCPLGEDVTVMTGVFVDSNNTILTEPGPQILISSGYEFFDSAAQEFAAAHDFDNQSGANRSYAMTTNFVYDAEACPAAPASQEEVGSSGGEDEPVSQQGSPQNESDSSTAGSS
ncbi:MAG: hypothetical protein WBA57_07985 [Elainellaceae cyanobacterium]